MNAYGKYLPLPHKKVHRKFMQQLMNDTRHSINNIAIESLVNRKLYLHIGILSIFINGIDFKLVTMEFFGVTDFRVFMMKRYR